MVISWRQRARAASEQVAVTRGTTQVGQQFASSVLAGSTPVAQKGRRRSPDSTRFWHSAILATLQPALMASVERIAMHCGAHVSWLIDCVASLLLHAVTLSVPAAMRAKEVAT